MELYHNNMSVCAQKVRLVLAEKDLRPIEHHKLLRNGDTHTPEYLALNPKGVVPTLIDNGQVIIESTIICEYLEDAYPDVPLMPADPVGRARVRAWTQLPDAGLHQACGMVSVGLAWRHQIKAAGGAQLRNRSSKALPSPAFLDIIERGPESPYFSPAIVAYDDAIAQMAITLSRQPWLAGGAYSNADIALLPYVLRLDHLALDWMWAGERRAVADWLARCQARANYRAIAHYIEPSYVELATREGRAATPRIQQMLRR